MPGTPGEAGPDPALCAMPQLNRDIQVFGENDRRWIAGSGPAMTP